MSTITLKNPPEARELSAMEAAAKVEIPPALWRSYRRARAAHPHERPSRAANIALDECHFTMSTTRGRLGRLLEKREQERGLRPDPGERREDEALAAAALAAEAEVVHEPDSLGAIEADASQRVRTLREQRQRLAPEALVDTSAKAEMVSLEDELREAERALELVDVARGESGRREAEAAERAESEARENSSRAATDMEPGLAKRKAAIDRHLAAAASETRLLADEQRGHCSFLAGGGMDQFNLRAHAFRADWIESAVAFHFEGTGVFRGPGRNYALVRTEAKQ